MLTEQQALDWIAACPARPTPPVIPGRSTGTITPMEAMANVSQYQYLRRPRKGLRFSETALRSLVRAKVADGHLADALGLGNQVNGENWRALRREIKKVKASA